MGARVRRVAAAIASVALPTLEAHAACTESWYQYKCTGCNGCGTSCRRYRRSCRACNGVVTCGGWVYIGLAKCGC
jgi:hypothetical protein